MTVGYHFPVVFTENHLKSFDPELSGQDTVVSVGDASALQVSQDGLTHIGFEAVLFELFHQTGGSAHQPQVFVSYLVALHACYLSAYGLGSLGDHHDGEAPAFVVSRLETTYHLVDIIGDLGDETYLGAAGDGSMQGDPAGITAHHLEDERAVVALGRGDQLVDRLGGDLDSRLETEGEVGGQQVVVDGLGHADDVQTFLIQHL